MSNELHQTRIVAQVCKIVHALSPGRVQNQETLNKHRFVVAPLAFLDGHVLLHAAWQPQRRNAALPAGSRPGRSNSSSGLGSTSNSNGDSVGEGFCIRRMPAIVRESRT